MMMAKIRKVIAHSILTHDELVDVLEVVVVVGLEPLGHELAVTQAQQEDKESKGNH